MPRGTIGGLYGSCVLKQMFGRVAEPLDILISDVTALVS